VVARASAAGAAPASERAPLNDHEETSKSLRNALTITSSKKHRRPGNPFKSAREDKRRVVQGGGWWRQASAANSRARNAS